MGLGLVRVVPGWVSVGRGALFQRTNAFLGIKSAKPGGVTSARANNPRRFVDKTSVNELQAETSKKPTAVDTAPRPRVRKTLSVA